jgi:uncharacterized protein with GYD domain
MPKYLVKASYNADGVKGLVKDGGSARRRAADELVGTVGGTVESYYFAFGPTDVFAVVDVPDHASAAAVATAVGASGSFSSVETVVLMTPEEMDDAMKKSVSFRPPGG